MEQQRVLLVNEHDEGLSVTELAAIYGVSRKTVYKWLARYEESGVAGLADLSRRPHSSPYEVSEATEDAIVAARSKWKWGPKKLLVKLCQSDSSREWPSVSTIAAVLQRKGLAVDRRRRNRNPVQGPPYPPADSPNSVWCADFKGYFHTLDGDRIDPLTISDACSRKLLRSQIVRRTNYTHARAVFEAGFREYGMPGRMHYDNGTPFSSVAPGGLSQLSMWFVRLGIMPELSRPGSPQDNGRHERMHRTLKEATASPPAANSRLQQAALDRFRLEYNSERPHEALHNLTPDACYWSSARLYPRREPELEYGGDMEVRVASQQGSIKWKGERTFISELFGHQPLGLKEVDGRWMQVFYGPVALGWFDTHQHRFVRKLPRELKEEKNSLEKRTKKILN